MPTGRSLHAYPEHDVTGAHKGVGGVVASEQRRALRSEVAEWMVDLMVKNGLMQPQIGGYACVGAQLDLERLSSALRLLFDTEPVLGCRFVAEGTRPRWERLDSIDDEVTVLVRPSELPAQDALAWLAHPFDPGSRAQLRSVLFRGADCDALAIKFSHVAVDGYCVKEGFYQVAEWYTRLGTDPYFSVLGQPPNRPRSISPIVRTASLTDRLGALRPPEAFPPTGWGLPAEPSVDGEPLYLRRTLAREAFMAARAWAAERGAAVDDLLLAAYCMTLRAQLEPHVGADAPVQFSCDYRPWLPSGTRPAFGNLSGSWWVDSHICGESLERSVRAIAEQSERWRAGRPAVSAALSSRLAEVMPYRLLARSARVDEASLGHGYPALTNVGVIDDARLRFDDAETTDAMVVGPIGLPPGFVLGACTFGDRLTLTAGIHTGSADRRRAEAIVDGVVTRLEIAAAL